ncbi:triphosphoribosyl-dephospho-CoA synthase CitG [Streptococcus parauberis]|uniref:Probable 2-(5''-triphosphoribosyl)-3'-dephosphocoenzyme-A synthase n=2 Tax=Streptococcus parauberis TaxID=1348 RepID=A0ABN0IQK0_9STRE|nr:triphosphoribosyl-dephospho-CoA synthase CitG [Streptococcus parauberis]AEF24555.1 2-(5''-triphosphoribosyl)-3'-dephosphocoenzyme-A synthase [Streptococcus parauberis KCTC 11537]AUT05034.1 Triphosphoribosyl-dephospho-CoA synthase [Streptococcus parauberis]EMF48505.1 2-(5''-triphosphoribosyl)-3'-dephosphocoenzyme-A synthase [Streptococcus parauberis KRS-02109]EMG25126.1 2-(5''-triphosphoribosyl)-3'-dephosphocoenzyme-A synthase [Streptococcus parauberis KRS-02083]KYP17966.1 2-(5''-triphosphor
MLDAPLLYFSQAASKALLYEVTLTPKPGLVDCANDGSHSDMTLATFIDSTAVLTAHFYRYIKIGFDNFRQDPQIIFNLLREEGIEAERSMFDATNGINTHKGVNFSFALILGATGAYLAQNPNKNLKDSFTADDTRAICQLIVPMTSHLIANDLQNLAEKEQLTYGEKLYLNYGIKGPRGEAAEGYPSLTKNALPYLRNHANSTSDKRFLQLKLLLHLMTFVEDANLIHRGGIGALRTVQKEAKELKDKNLASPDLCKQLSDYNDHLVQLHLSPGGSADLFALSLYFAFLEKII